MQHFQKYSARKIRALPLYEAQGWQLKRYAVLAKDREFSEAIVAAASAEALNRLPAAGSLDDGSGNHGVGLQIIHFAETAVVSPIFYWMWGSVLGRVEQIRASWQSPENFGDGVAEVLGCVWEMDLVNYEISAWKASMLSGSGEPKVNLARYLAQHSG